jgi:hypothetical protein
MSTNQQQEEGENVNQPINLFRIACTHEKDALPPSTTMSVLRIGITPILTDWSSSGVGIGAISVLRTNLINFFGEYGDDLFEIFCMACVLKPQTFDVYVAQNPAVAECFFQALHSLAKQLKQ